MSTTPISLTDALQIGDAQEHRGIVVCPLFPRSQPRASYITLGDALTRGLTITELGTTGSVPELLVTNPLDDRVLLYDGEELLGAKQNRILNVSVLVGSHTSIGIPVSCVEEGRWSQASLAFDASPQTAHPELRRRKAESLAERPLTRGVAQGEVWDAVREKAGRMGVSSATGANNETFRAFGERLDSLERAFPADPGQSGALISIGDNCCLDWVSRPDAFGRLWPKLRRGYMLDALEALDRPAHRKVAERFFGLVLASAQTPGPSPGIGTDLRLSSYDIVGSGLELDGELLQLSAFTGTAGRSTGRIARPSRRRAS